MAIKAALVGLLLAALLAVLAAAAPSTLRPSIVLASSEGVPSSSMVTGPREDVSPLPGFQAVPPAGAIATACAALGGPVGCAAAGVATVAVYCTVYGGCPTLADVQAGIDMFQAWASGSPSDFDQLLAQVIAHPTYVDPTQNLLDSWRQHINSVTSGGWVSSGTALHSANTWIGPAASNNTIDASASWEGTLTPVNGCTASLLTVDYSWPANPGAVAGRVELDIKVYRTSDDVLLASHQGTGSVSAGAGAGGISGQAFTNNAGHCAYMAVPVYIVANKLRDAGSGLLYGGGFAKLRIQYNDNASSPRTLDLLASAFSGAQVTPWPTEWEAPGMRVNVLQDADDLEGWDGVTALPLANGTTGEVVTTPGATTAPDDQAWWEGLFGGVTGWLRRIWERLQDIESAISGITSAITALPATIAALFDPSIAWADFMSTGYPGVRDDWAAVAPGCYLDDVGGAVLFSTGGDSLPTLTLGVPGATIDVELAVSDTVADISFPVSTAVVAIIMWLWAFSKIERPPWSSPE